MDKYTVKLYARAYQDLEEIYSYIANSLLEPDTALTRREQEIPHFYKWGDELR